MGQRGRKRVEEHFSEAVCLAKLIALFRSVAAEKVLPTESMALANSEPNCPQPQAGRIIN
jgi:hypothetical protein